MKTQLQLRSRYLPFALAGVLILLAALVLIRHLEKTNAKVARSSGAAVPVQVHEVGKGSVDEELAAEGSARELQSIPLSSFTKGKVARIVPWLGDVVHKGQILVEMDLASLEEDLRYARDQVRGTEKQLELSNEKVALMQSRFDQGYGDVDDLNAARLVQYQTEVTLAKLKSSLSTSAQNYKYARIEAPVDGIVTARDVYEGSVLKDSTPIITVSQIDPILIEASFSEDNASNLYAGQAARVSFYAFPGQSVEGKVQSIKPKVDSTRLITVQIRVPNPELKLLPGMHGIAYLDNRRTDVLKIPSIALISTQQDRAYAYVVDSQGRARARKLQLGAYSEGYMEVKSGLSVGEKLVVIGQANLKDGDAVRIVGSKP